MRNEITAPMPGTILKVNVAAGQHFEAHSPLVIMESMKMEITVTAHAAGSVRELRAPPGRTVRSGDVIIVLEER